MGYGIIGTWLTACAIGAGSQSADIEGIVALGHHDLLKVVNDVWAYEGPDGTTFALVGVSNGLVVFDVSTTPETIDKILTLPSPNSTWHDFKHWRHYVYGVNEGSGGLQIWDFRDPRNPVTLPSYEGFSTAHNLWIDDDGYAYVVGSNLSNGGIRILDLADPENPVEIATWEERYVHDIWAQDGLAYAACISDGTLDVIDLSDPTAPQTISSTPYPGAVTHNAWPTRDGAYLATSDEVVGGHLRMWDVSDLGNPFQVDAWDNLSSIIHNVIVLNDYAYISHYADGLQIVDVSDPVNVAPVASWDTSNMTGPLMLGAWGVYPLSPSGIIMTSDMLSGLWTCRFPGGVELESDLSSDASSVSRGESLRLDISLANISAEHVREIDVWVVAADPNGLAFRDGEPIAPLRTLALRPGNSVQGSFRVTVPPNLPTGEWSLVLRSGRSFLHPETQHRLIVEVLP